jgi:hypothetical protein
VAEHTEGLTYFTHEVGGRLHAGWFRRRPGGRIEVFTRTKMRTEFLGNLSIEEHARAILADLVDKDDFSTVRDDPHEEPSVRRKK